GTVYVTTPNPPFINYAPPAQICQAGQVTLTSNTCTPGEIKWYDSPNACVPIFSGSPFTTHVSASTNFYTNVTTLKQYDGIYTSALSDNSFYARAGQMFDVEAASGKTIEITGIKVRPDVSGAQTVRVYWRPESHIGYHTNPDVNGNTPGTGWIEIGNGYAINGSAGSLTPTLTLASPIVIPAGCKYGIYIQQNTRYRGDYTGAVSYPTTNTDFIIYAGW